MAGAVGGVERRGPVLDRAWRTIFRVDNPHTKALPFWEWMIGEVKELHPELLFLAEAFTRPKLMYGLAKVVFSVLYLFRVA